jgi:anti-sigma regulatory factor (Ser/Thr protein kinase)
LAKLSTTEAPDGRGSEGFRHEALLYAGIDDFLAQTLPFLRDGAAAGDGMLAVVDAPKIDALREALGLDAAEVTFADMREVGTNPARIIPAWRAFVDARPGRRLRGIGEPIWATRSPAELVECHRHEALLNLAFADATGFELLCPYDVDALDSAVIEAAHHTHPQVAHDETHAVSDGYAGLDVVAAPFAAPLPAPPDDARVMPFELATLGALRSVVAAWIDEAGVPEPGAGDLVVAANELATNSVVHGGGHGVLRFWCEPGSAICEVSDNGAIVAPLAGRARPAIGEVGGQGLWVCNQLCDLVQIRAFPDGGAVRLHMRR